MLAEISFYNVVLFVHIAAVVLAFGVTFSFPLVMSYARRSDERHMAFYHRMQELIGSRLIGPLGMLVLLAGLYLAIEGPYEFGDPWIGSTLLLLIIIMGIGGGFLGPRESRLAEHGRPRPGGEPERRRGALQRGLRAGVPPGAQPSRSRSTR